MGGHSHGHGHGFCCFPHTRHFLSRKEKKENLERYREQLKKEIDGIDEHLKGHEGK